MGFSLMAVSILLSFKGTKSEAATSQASIAFFVIVSLIETSRSLPVAEF